MHVYIIDYHSAPTRCQRPLPLQLGPAMIKNRTYGDVLNHGIDAMGLVLDIIMRHILKGQDGRSMGNAVIRVKRNYLLLSS